MKLSNEKIEVAFAGETKNSVEKAECIVIMDTESSIKMAKKKMYRSLVDSISNDNVRIVAVVCGDSSLIFKVTYKEEDCHPDYYCDIASKIVKFSFKKLTHQKEFKQTKLNPLIDRGQQFLQKGKNKVSNIDVDKLKSDADRKLNKLSDKLNGLSDYYNYNGEADEVVKIPADSKEPMKSTESLESETKIEESEENFSENLTYKNDKEDEDKNVEKNEIELLSEGTIVETLYTSEIENFVQGIFVRV